MKTYAPPRHITAPDIGQFFGRNGMGLPRYLAAEDEYRKNLAKWVTDQAKLIDHKSPLIGKIVRVPFADGYAEYMVIPEGRSVALMTIPLGDAWRDGYFERSCTVKELRENRHLFDPLAA